MKKLITLVVAVGLTLTFASVAAARVHHKHPIAHAAWVGLNGCQLHSWAGLKYPNSVPSEDWIYGSGWINNCGGLSGDAYMSVQTCLQNLVTGGWANVSCFAPSTYKYEASVSETFGRVCPVKNRYYREWTWGKVNGQTATYLSTGFAESNNYCP